LNIGVAGRFIARAVSATLTSSDGASAAAARRDDHGDGIVRHRHRVLVGSDHSLQKTLPFPAGLSWEIKARRLNQDE
jgi:hypothetical protein